jgi:hypothetical protein
VTKGEPVIGGLHGATRHYFCPHCMSWMFTRAEGFDWFVNLRATMLDDPSWFTPFGKRFVSCCGSRESGEALAAWWADSTSHLVWSGCAPCNDRALVRKAKAFGPTRADRAAEQADYRTWTADATAKLERDLILPWVRQIRSASCYSRNQGGLLVKVDPTTYWCQPAIRISPENGVLFPEVGRGTAPWAAIAYNARPAADRLRRRRPGRGSKSHWNKIEVTISATIGGLYCHATFMGGDNDNASSISARNDGRLDTIASPFGLVLALRGSPEGRDPGASLRTVSTRE